MVSKVQLLYWDSWRVLIQTGLSSQVAKYNPRVCEMKSQLKRKEIGRVAAIAVAGACKQELDALRV